MLIEISDAQIEYLLECKKTQKRGFKNWEIKYLLGEAIREFHEKYTEPEQNPKNAKKPQKTKIKRRYYTFNPKLRKKIEEMKKK